MVDVELERTKTALRLLYAYGKGKFGPVWKPEIEAHLHVGASNGRLLNLVLPTVLEG